MFIDDGFNDVLSFKGIELRRLTLADNYYMIKACGDALTINMDSEKDLELIGIPYLTYVYRKAFKCPDFVGYWQLIKWCLLKTFVNCDIEISENEIIACVKTEEYPRYVDEYESILSRLDYLSCEIEINQGEIIDKVNQKSNIESMIYNKILLTCEDFDGLRTIICAMNGFDNTRYDPYWESVLKEAKNLKNTIVDSGLTLSDLINTLAFYLRKFPCELKSMDYYTFNHYIKLMGEFEEYKLNRGAELQGTEFKQKITHWFTHYKPVGKYDDVVTSENITKVLE
jgi:hypothetical protein